MPDVATQAMTQKFGCGHEVHLVVGDELHPRCWICWPPSEHHGFSRELNEQGIARAFHGAYEELAPEHGYETREESRTQLEDVPEKNRGLMTATVQKLLDEGLILPG